MWFKNKNCSSVEVARKKTSAQIQDKEYIKRLITRIERLPADSDKMIKMGPDAELLTMTFKCGADETVLEFWEKSLKTPSTGFNSESDLENQIYDEMDAILKPGLKKQLPKVRGHVYKVGNFTMTYIEQTFVDAAPATISVFTDHYLLNGKTNLKISYGQNPPQPLKFKAGSRFFVLMDRDTAFLIK